MMSEADAGGHAGGERVAPRDWGEGYVVDVAYVHTFLAGLAPLNLALAARLAGTRPPDVDRPFAYLDLGCGNGFTTALVAAANPHAEVCGVDFNPAHIRNARATADAAGVGNVSFLEASFADLLDAALPQFDIVAIHGIWSWVSGANRDRIVDCLARCVKPGGLVVVSYNCHPGWDALLPLRRLMIAAAEGPSGSGERVTLALTAARRLHDAGADYFRNNPAASAALDRLEREDPRYLAHEYLNANWTLFHPSEVAAAMARAGLSYAGQARIADNLDRFWLSPAERALVGEQRDVSTAQGLRDLILDRRFRRDLFVRGKQEAGEDETAAWFAERRFVLGRSRADCALAATTRVGNVAVPPLGEAVLDVLADRPATGAVLAARIAADPSAVQEALGVLAAMGHLLPALDQAGDAARRIATDRFNAVALAAARCGEPVAALASPVTGSGAVLSAGEQLLLDAYRFGVPLEAIAVSEDAGGPGMVERFRRDRLPALAMLGIA